jgi:aminopeptidase
MQNIAVSPSKSAPQFPSFSLSRLLRTVFNPQKGEKLCILIDLEDPSQVKDFSFLKNKDLPVQKMGYDIFYQGLRNGVMKELGLAACDLYAYQKTGGSNLELPATATASNGKTANLINDIYPAYDIILCITDYSATAPLTAAAKRYGFRGSTMHGLNDVILKSGLAVDYNEVSRATEKLRQGMTHADSVDIDFEVDRRDYHLHVDLGRQDAQKSHGICHAEPDVVNLPAGEVYFVPIDAKGTFPIKFDDGTLALMHVDQCRVNKIDFIRGNQKTVDEISHKFKTDPFASVLGELGFGTQVLPFAHSDIQDEKIFGTFHIATGRNDHLSGKVTLDKFVKANNATHDDILFSSTKTPEIIVKQVRMNRNGKTETLIKNYEPSEYLLGLLKK